MKRIVNQALKACLFAMLMITLAPCRAEVAPDKLTPIDLRQVKAGGEIGRRIDVTINNNMLKINADKDFRSHFINKKAKTGYIGMGKLIDTAARLAAYSGDEKMLALKKNLVDTVIKAQEADGYIGQIAPAERMWGMWDIHEAGYVVWGLLTDYHFFGEQRSLDAARKAADYIIDRWNTMPKDWAEREKVAVHVSVTGLEREIVDLYKTTGNKKYLDFLVKDRDLVNWDLPIVIGRRPQIEGHTYAFMTRCMAQLELYRLLPDPKLLGETRKALDFMTRGNGLAITGGLGQWEIWTDDQDGRGALGETCSTAYQMRVYDSMLRLEGSPFYGDLMERTIFNTLFGAQSPDGRRLRYFTPTEGERVYYPDDTMCCPCNFRRIIAELPTMFYYHSGNGLAVNLYTASKAEFDLGGGVSLKVSQVTDYPSSGHIVINMDPSKPASFPLRLRIPAWANGALAAVNGQVVAQEAKAGSFLDIEREWKAGDKVTLDLPMKWRLVRGRQRQAGRVAVMRGPQIFCLNPAQDKKLAKQDGVDLGRIVLEPASLKEPVADKSVRPGGIACNLMGWAPSFDLTPKGDLKLKLTEFPDPNGKATYFRLRDMSVAVDDELLAGK